MCEALDGIEYLRNDKDVKDILKQILRSDPLERINVQTAFE